MADSLRRATEEDADFLWAMLYEASYAAESGVADVAALRRHPELARYVEGWGDRTDLGIVAVDDDTREPVGRRVAAAAHSRGEGVRLRRRRHARARDRRAAGPPRPRTGRAHARRAPRGRHGLVRRRVAQRARRQPCAPALRANGVPCRRSRRRRRVRGHVRHHEDRAARGCYWKIAATMLMVTARITAPNRYPKREWPRTVRRRLFWVTSVSATW